MPKKNIFKKFVDEMLDDESKQNLKQSYNDFKKKYDGFIDEISCEKQKKQFSKKTTDKSKKQNDTKIEKLKEMLPLIIFYIIFIWIICFSFAMTNFLDGNILLGIIFILLIPTITLTITMICLKYVNLTLKHQIKILINKIIKIKNIIIEKTKKLFNNEIFIISIIAIMEILFMILMIIITASN